MILPNARNNDVCQDHWTEEPLTAADREKKKNKPARNTEVSHPN
jgi:hypothetical protein